MKKFSFLLAVVIALTLVWTGSAQADVYKNFQQLKARQDRNIDYRISYHNGPSSTLVMAIHGGSIEPGTCKLAKEVAKRSGADWYTFEGIKKRIMAHYISLLPASTNQELYLWWPNPTKLCLSTAVLVPAKSPMWVAGTSNWPLR